jgi:hypothetical protein
MVNENITILIGRRYQKEREKWTMRPFLAKYYFDD